MALWEGSAGGVGVPSADGLTQAPSGQFLETLDIQVAKTNLSLRLSGHGVMPSTVCSVGEVLDMGYVMARDTVTATVKVRPLCRTAKHNRSSCKKEDNVNCLLPGFVQVCQ